MSCPWKRKTDLIFWIVTIVGLIIGIGVGYFLGSKLMKYGLYIR